MFISAAGFSFYSSRVGLEGGSIPGTVPAGRQGVRTAAQPSVGLDSGPRAAVTALICGDKGMMAKGLPQHWHLIPGAAGTQLCSAAMLKVTSFVKNRRQRISALHIALHINMHDASAGAAGGKATRSDQFSELSPWRVAPKFLTNNAPGLSHPVEGPFLRSSFRQ